MKTHPLLPLPDYQRIYQVIYSVLQASEVACTHRACILFTIAGTLILREHYKLPATISTGVMAMMVNEKNSTVAMYGRMGDGPESDSQAFHAWVECKGWLIDFMAPIMGIGFKEDGHVQHVPRWMLQKPLADQKTCINDLRRTGDYYLEHDSALAESLIDSQSGSSIDLANVCLSWFRRPPSALKELALGDSQGTPKKLVLRAPSIDGVW
ncbi:DUF2026 family protein [Rhodoferax sp. BLA1]|uniref:DUF2026 family protein n=1 Tax=Rhodoferax sp. BLA1 TaxID=2576062 RepID=UPI0015D339DC|nr:DUF2026 family protein [Rhodoferax sp. BLA1]